MEYYVYILQSEKNRSFYIGCTTNIEARMGQHNAGHTVSTKKYRPWKLIYQEHFSNKKEAFKREWFLKHPKGYIEKLYITKQYGGVA